MAVDVTTRVPCGTDYAVTVTARDTDGRRVPVVVEMLASWAPTSSTPGRGQHARFHRCGAPLGHTATRRRRRRVPHDAQPRRRAGHRRAPAGRIRRPADRRDERTGGRGSAGNGRGVADREHRASPRWCTGDHRATTRSWSGSRCSVPPVRRSARRSPTCRTPGDPMTTRIVIAARDPRRGRRGRVVPAASSARRAAP